MKIDIKQTIKVIEASESIPKAAESLGINRYSLYKRLRRRNLKVIRTNKLKVVPKGDM
jgi:transcriptional regulator of acetoin/glycerol metabolism